MGPEHLGDFLREGLFVVIIIVAVVLVPGLIVGLIVATFQAATQINEQTLTFLPRFVVTIFAIMHLGPWLLTSLTDFFNQLFVNIPMLIG